MIKRKFNNIKNNNNKIRVISYNILAPITISKNSHHKISCSDKCIKWKNRFKIIKKEINYYNPDIITLQEVQTNFYYSDIFPYFFDKKYMGYYVPQKKNEEYELDSDEKNFGVAIFFKYNKFYSLKIGIIDYDKIVTKFLNKNKLNIFLEKSNKRFSSLIINLKDKITNKEFYIITVHLESKPQYTDINNLQTYIIMKYIEKLSENIVIPIILTGDFNFTPDSSAYIGITKGISTNNFDVEKNINYSKPFIKTPKIFTKYPMKSSYKNIYGKEPKYTNYTKYFKNTLDYIFVNSKINILAVLKEIDNNYLNKIKSIPNDNYPSDHFIQVTDLKLK